MLAAASPTPAGALAATEHDEDRMQKEGGWDLQLLTHRHDVL